MKLQRNDYNIILADVPWDYKDKRKLARAHGGSAFHHYDSMTITEIKALPVSKYICNDALLFFWFTAPQLPHVEPIMNAWGFQYKTIAFTWLKTNKNSGQPFLGVGHYTRSNCEFVALGRRGKPNIINSNQSSVIISPRAKHSEKPKQVHDRIVTMCGDLPRIELFARDRVAGWDCWGNEVDEA